MAKLNAEWSGVIRIGSAFSLDCRLFSANANGHYNYPIRKVHVRCHSAVRDVDDNSHTTDAEEMGNDALVNDVQGKVLTTSKAEDALLNASVKSETVTVGSREQFYCPVCQKPIKTDEIGSAIETEYGLISVSDDDLATLEFRPSKIAPARFIHNSDPALEIIGVTRRLYVMPKPAALQEYAQLFDTMVATERYAFIPLLIMKRAAHVAILKPIHIPETVFGTAFNVLVLDILNNTDKLRSPDELPDFFGALPEIELDRTSDLCVHALKPPAPLEVSSCINPKKQIFRKLIARIITHAKHTRSRV